MTPSAQLLDDPERLAAVERLDLVGQPYEERFDRITRTAQRVLSAPLAFLNLIAADALWVTSCVGFDERQVDRNVAFCSHAIAAPQMLVVDDLTQDDRFRHNPLVVAEPHVRAYAGRPLRTPDGQVVGTLCVMDLQARRWDDQDRQALEDLGAWAESELARGEVERQLDAGQRLRTVHEQVLGSVFQGILGTDAAGTVIFANPAAGTLLGWEQDQLVGQALHPLLHPGGTCRTACPLSDLDAPTLWQCDVLSRRDGSSFPVQLSTAPLSGDGEAVGAVLVFEDVTDQQEVERLKDEFVSVVSHELRTPLTSLRGSLGLLAGGVLGSLSVQGQQMADIALSSTQRLVRLVDDILDLERLVAGQVVLERRRHDPADLADAAVHAVQGLADTAGIPLRVSADTGGVWCDGDRVVQVLVNLLGNAVKFSPAGSPVDLRMSVQGAAWRIEVEDRGRGIPPGQLERVFDRFAQVDASDSRTHGGSGLGLAISRNVVETHGGTIAVRSEVGVGTTFTVLLPQRGPSAAARPLGRRAGDPGAP